MSLTILLVEDDAPHSAMLAAELRLAGHRVTIAGDGRAALAAIDGDQHDAMLLDRMLPDLDGIAVVERLRRANKTLPIIMVSALGRAIEKIEALDAGADDYVVKPVSAAELAARLRAVIRGRGWTAAGDDTLRAGDIVVSPSRFRAWRDGKAIDLGKLELTLLAEFARNVDAVLTRAMLIERVWGYDFEPETNLVDVYVRRLRLKLTADGGADPIATVRGVGYLLRG